MSIFFDNQFFNRFLAAISNPDVPFNYSDPFFCNICGGPATSRGLLKHSTFRGFDQVEDEDFEEDRDLFMDYCDCEARDHPDPEMHDESCDSLRGYDSELVPRADTKWLEDLRMLAPHIPGAHLFDPNDSEDVEILTPLGYGIDTSDDFFSYPRVDDMLPFCALERSRGFLIHDTCLGMLKRVHRHTASPTKSFNLRDLLLFFKLYREERDQFSDDWGHGDAFGIEGRYRDLRSWNPVTGSEWTVIDPKGPFDFDSIIEKVSRVAGSTLSFKLSPAKSNRPPQNDYFSSIPPELRLAVLGMLPTASVLNLFLASSSCRELSVALPQSFWKSRLFFDVPWCADMILAHTTGIRGSHIRFDKLLYQLKEASKTGAWVLSNETGGNGSSSTRDSLRLKNERRVWLNCVQILKDIESRNAIVQQQHTSIWASRRDLTSHKAASVSWPDGHLAEATSDVYFVLGPDRATQLLGIIAYLAIDGHIVGVEFQLSHGHSRQLFGIRSGKVNAVAFDSNAPIIAIMISFGPLEPFDDDSAIFGLGIVVEDHPSEPAYILGAWDSQDVMQVFRAEPDMEVIGITGEFNSEIITAFGIITANKASTPVKRSRRSAMDLQTNTRWVGSHPPLEWPLDRYSLSPRFGDPSCVDNDTLGLDPPVFYAPVYFVNLTGRRATSIKVFGTPCSPGENAFDHAGRAFTGFLFRFMDGSVETVGETPANEENGVIEMQENEVITDLTLHFAHATDAIGSPTRLNGIQFITNLKRNLILGRKAPRFYRRSSSCYREVGEDTVCGIQIGLTPLGVMSMGLVFWQS